MPPKLVLKKAPMIVLKRPTVNASRPMGFNPAPKPRTVVHPLCDLRREIGFIQRVNLNSQITEILSRLISATQKVKAACTDAGEKRKHGFRIQSFSKALDIIKNHPEPISSGAEASKLKGIGKGIALRIDEILKSGNLTEIDRIDATVDPNARAIMELCQITGIGEVKARALNSKFGVTGVADLIYKYEQGQIKVAPNQLTHHIALGLKYYYDLAERIPWAEVDQIKQLLEQTVARLNPELHMTICGSYRRGKATCGDIDVLVTHSRVTTQADAEKSTYLKQLVSQLTKQGFLVGHLTEKGSTKYMGVCKLSSKHKGRRIDIRFVPKECYPAAILYFTGSGQFNKIMRFKANQLGFTINEYGIYHYINGQKGARVEVETEKDIFKVINCVYLDPNEREF